MPVTRNRHRELGEPALLRFGLENHELVRFLKWQALQEEVVDQTEDGGVHPYAEREGQDGEKRERGRFQELADGEAEIDHKSEVRVQKSEVRKIIRREERRWDR